VNGVSGRRGVPDVTTPACTEGTGRAESGRPPGFRRGLAAMVVVAAAALAGYIWGAAGLHREHDRHQLRREVQLIEAAIRAGHPADAWLHAEGTRGGRVPAQEQARRDAVLQDLERLARLEGFSLVGLEVELAQEQGLARFHVIGHSVGGRLPPARGEWLFERRPNGWQLVASRLFDR
jgi:hypothetical protein